MRFLLFVTATDGAECVYDVFALCASVPYVPGACVRGVCAVLKTELYQIVQEKNSSTKQCNCRSRVLSSSCLHARSKCFMRA